MSQANVYLRIEGLSEEYRVGSLPVPYTAEDVADLLSQVAWNLRGGGDHPARFMDGGPSANGATPAEG